MADCNQLVQTQPVGTYLDCIASCSGAGPDDFVCADGRQFVRMAGVCDGQYQCLDGSDEVGCSDGGADGA